MTAYGAVASRVSKTHHGRFAAPRALRSLNLKRPSAGETLYGWDPEEKRLAFWYWNSEGEVLIGAVEYRPGSIVFPTKYVTDKGTVELRATWTRRGQDSYRVEQSQRTGEVWKPLWTMELKRHSGPPRPPRAP